MYTTLGTKDLKHGDRVYFVDNSLAQYTIKSSNPLTGTKYECAGTVVGFEYGSTCVMWDNGTSNSYTDYTLAKIEEACIISIW